MKLGIIDIGSNSVRLLLADMDSQGFRSRNKYLTTTRIAEGLAQSGRLAVPAMERSFTAVAGYHSQALAWGAEAIYCYATSAVRDAANGSEFMERLCGLPVLRAEMIGGQDEAEYAFRGAQAVLSGMLDNARDMAVVDVGGASTELIRMRDGKTRACSAALGCVRCKEMFVHTDPIEAAEAEALEAYCQELAADLVAAVGSADGLIGVGGSATQLAMLMLGLEKYNPNRVTGFAMAYEDLASLFSQLKQLTVEERKRLAGMEEQRADIIPMGAAIILAVMEACGADCIYASDGDGLEGYALRVFSGY